MTVKNTCLTEEADMKIRITRLAKTNTSTMKQRKSVLLQNKSFENGKSGDAGVVNISGQCLRWHVMGPTKSTYTKSFAATASQLDGKICKIVLHLLIIGMLGWNWDAWLSFGIHPNLLTSQTPSNHPYGFVSYIDSSGPKRKLLGSQIIQCFKLGYKNQNLLTALNSIGIYQAFRKVKAKVCFIVQLIK